MTGVLAFGWALLFLRSPAWMSAVPEPLGSVAYGAMFGIALTAFDLLAGLLPGGRRKSQSSHA